MPAWPLLSCSFIALLSVACCLDSNVQTALSEGDRADLERRLSNLVSTASSRDVWFLASALNFLNEKALKAHHPNLCATAKRGFESQDLEVFSLAWQSAQLLNCEVQQPFPNVAVLEAAVQQENLAAVYAGAEGLKSLRVGFKAEISEDLDLHAIANQLLARLQLDDTSRKVAQDAGSSLSASYALHSIAAIATIRPSAVNAESLNTITEKAGVLVERLITSLDASRSLRRMTLMLRGLKKIADIAKQPFEIDPDALMQMSSLLMSFKHRTSSSDAYFLLDALNLVTSVPKAKPVAVHMAASALTGDQESPVHLRVTDLFDHPVPNAKLVVTSILKRSTLKPVKGIGELHGKAGRGGSFAVGLPPLKAGQYLLEISVQAPESYIQLQGVRRAIRVRGSVEVGPLTMAVTQRNGTEVEAEYTVQFPDAVSSPLSLDATTRITLEFNCTPFVPQQTFIRFLHTSGASAVIVGKAAAASSSRVVVELNMGKRDDDDDDDDDEEIGGSKVLSLGPGEVSMQVLVGDALLVSPIAWTVAHAEIVSEAPLSHAMRTEEMEYTPVAPPAVESEILAMAFSGLTLVATFFCVSTIRSQQANHSSTTKAGTGTVGDVAMKGMIASYAFLVIWWWCLQPGKGGSPLGK